MLRVRDKSAAVCLTLILVTGAVVRLYRLDLMEFKDDEARLYDFALQHARGEIFMLAGMPISFGGRCSALPMYVFAIPCAIGREPVACVRFAAVLNMLAVYLAYLAGCGLEGRRTGLCAALIFSLSPWAIAYSRELWPMTLIPVGGALALLCLVRLLRSDRFRYVLGMSAVLSIMTQIHPSAGPLVLTAPLSFLRGPRERRWRLVRQWGWGSLLFLALFAPFLAGQATMGFGDVKRTVKAYGAEDRPRALLRYKLQSTGYALGMLSRGGFSYNLVLFVRRGGALQLEGDADEFCENLRSLPGALAIGFGLLGWGFLVAIWRSRRDPVFAAPVLWLVLIPLASLTLPKRIHPHYYTATYPAQFILAGLGFSSLFDMLRRRSQRLARLAATVLVLTACDGLLFYGQFLSLIERHGGSTGEYGICYNRKRAVADDIARLARGHPVIVRDCSHPIPCPLAFRVLLKERGVQMTERLQDADSVFLIANSRFPCTDLPAKWRQFLVAQTAHPPLRLYQFRGVRAGD